MGSTTVASLRRHAPGLGAGATENTAATSVALSAFLLRIALGIVFLAHAEAKVFTFTIPGTVAFFVAHGFPGWTVYPVVAMEILGGLALLLGLKTRWVAVALLPVLLGALTVHWPNGWSFVAPDGGWEYIAFLVAAQVALIGLGDGAFSLGARFERSKA